MNGEQRSLAQMDSFTNSFINWYKRDLFDVLFQTVIQITKEGKFEAIKIGNKEIYIVYMQDKMNFFRNNFE
jgi:hypothetical protein